MIEIKYCENTVGCRIGDEIFIHPELEKHPELFRAILSHEFEHTDGFSVQDVKNDLFGHNLDKVKREFYRFMISHPRTLLGYLPLSKIGKYWTFDFVMFSVWTLAIIVGVLMGVYL